MTQTTPAVYPPAPPAPFDGLAIASFVCALCGLGLIPVILGHIALRRIRLSGTRGSAFAIVGLVLGYLTIAAVAAAAVGVVAVVALTAHSR